MQKHLEETLTAAGLTPEQVKALAELPEDAKDFKTDTYVAPIHTTIETKVKNDPKFYEGLNKENLPKEFLKTLETEQYGRAASIVRSNMLKAVGLKEDDFKELGEEGKKIDIFTPAFVKKLSEGKVTDKELQQKLIEANQEIEALKGGQPELEKKYKGEADTRVNEFVTKGVVLSSIASVPGLKAPAKYLVPNILDQLRGKYALVVDGETVEIRQKDKPDLKVTYDNGTKVLTLDLAIKAILETDKLVEDKKQSSSSHEKIDVNTDEKGLKITKGVKSKMAARMEEDEKMGK